MSLKKILPQFLGFGSAENHKQSGYFSTSAIWQRRLTRFYREHWVWVLSAAAIIVVMTLSISFQNMLKREAERIIFQEVQQVTTSSGRRIEDRLNGATAVLRDLAKSGITTCGGRQMIAFAEAAKGQSAIARISLVDASGQVMCSTAPNRTERVKLLPRHTNLHPRVTLVQPDERSPYLIAVSWHIKDGLRLSALIDGRRIKLDAPPAVFGGNMHREVLLNGNALWIGDGIPLSSEQRKTSISGSMQGQRFPIVVQVELPILALAAINHTPKLIAPALVLAFLGIIGITMLRLNQSLSRSSETSIESALDDGQIQPMFQPLLDLTSGQVIGAEVLMRWRRKDGTMASPADFIHRVEQADLTCELTASLLNSAIVELGDVFNQHKHLALSINLFPRDIRSMKVVNFIEETLRGRAIKPEQLIFEVTERRGLDNLDRVQPTLSGLTKLGARIALDNAGSGHLGLSGLRQLWPDVVKIDKVLIDALGREEHARSIIDTIAGLADELAIGIVAEGVETVDQMKRLSNLGITVAQGYLFSKPLTSDDFREFLRKAEKGEIRRLMDNADIRVA